MQQLRSAVVGLGAAVGLLIAGCSGNDGADGASPPGGSSSSGGASGPLAVVDGVEIPSSLGLCDVNLVPSSGSGKIAFTWRAVPGATQYAVRATKAAKGATESTEIHAALQTALRYDFPEAVSGTSYRIEVYALADRTPLCTLDGLNGVTPS